MAKRSRKSEAQAGIKGSESVWSRMLRAFPLLLVFAAAVVYMGPQHFPEINPAEVASQKGYLDEAGGVPVKMNYTGLQGFDGFVRQYVAMFTFGMAGLDDSKQLILYVSARCL